MEDLEELGVIKEVYILFDEKITPLVNTKWGDSPSFNIAYAKLQCDLYKKLIVLSYIDSNYSKSREHLLTYLETTLDIPKQFSREFKLEYILHNMSTHFSKADSCFIKIIRYPYTIKFEFKNLNKSYEFFKAFIN